MMSGTALFVVCCVLYKFSGGRWSILLGAIALFVMYGESNKKDVKTTNEVSNDQTSKTTLDQSFKKQVKSKPITKSTESPILMLLISPRLHSTPTTTSQIPRAIKSRAKRSPKLFKASKPIQSLNADPTLTKSTINLLDSQVYIFYTTLTGSSYRVAKTLLEKLESLHT